MTINTRNGRPPNAGEMMALRIIMLIIIIVAILKEVLQVTIETLYFYMLVRLASFAGNCLTNGGIRDIL
jgi:hypothetical protein